MSGLAIVFRGIGKAPLFGRFLGEIGALPARARRRTRAQFVAAKAKARRAFAAEGHDAFWAVFDRIDHNRFPLVSTPPD